MNVDDRPGAQAVRIDSHLGDVRNASMNCWSFGLTDLMCPTHSSSDVNWPTRGKPFSEGRITLYGRSAATRASNSASASLTTATPAASSAVASAAFPG
eukprot:CAMPEP_0195580160 /NCGR_PEP_ID=MMETSP0814-20130614/17180_1 /TAXON_ID=97485 /ORGANISM="Prymnesium parvum, Strain Texoma1" /LENGTH=97 /DNA_ID=CAMNT_0040717177 /DNA_START=304 /DNA_END=594 /DNA_ORIENTATION=-